jgi:hypothetical protein
MPARSHAVMSANILHDREFLPFQLDLAGQRVLFVRFNAQQREDAAFLDQRALPSKPEGVWLPLSILDAPPSTEARMDAIFHIGHCGSTLLSRLLDTWRDIEGLREPLPLRTLAAAWREPATNARELLPWLMAYWRRPLSPRTRVAIKATSSCNVLIEPLLCTHGIHRAVFLDMPLERWLATLLKSEGSLHDAAAATEERAGYLQELGIVLDKESQPRSIVEACAMGWLVEQMRFSALAQGEYVARILRIDFEDLLTTPEMVLHQIATHLELDPEGVARAVDSPAWGRYSKAQQHGYGREDRSHDLALAKQRFGAQIAAGCAWVETLMGYQPERFSATASIRLG